MTSSIVPVKSSIFIEEGKSLRLMAEAFGTNNRAVTYEWNFGDDSTSVQGAVVIHRYYLAGHYPLTLIVRDDKGTVGIIERTVVVETLPLIITALNSQILDEEKGIVAFEATAATASSELDSQSYSRVPSWASASVPSDISSVDTSTADAITSNLVTSDQVTSRLVGYVWNFGDGSTPASGQKAVHKFSQSGTYYVSVIVSSPSGTTAAQVHQITLDKVIPNRPIKDNKEVLKDYPVTFNSPFTDSSILKTHTIRWNFGDGTTVENELAPEHAYQKTGSYMVSLEITNEKGKTTISKIPVEVVPVVPQILSLSAKAASKSEDAIDFSAVIDNPQSEALTYTWDFGDGSNKTYSEKADTEQNKGRNVSHVYAEEGTYAVTLKVSNKTGGQAVEVISVAIDSVLQIEGIAYPNHLIKGKAAAFSARAASRQKDQLIYQWYFQNARENADKKASRKAGQAVSFVFLEAGLWSVTLTVADGTKVAVETFTAFVEERELGVEIQAKPSVLVGRSARFRAAVKDYADSRASKELADLREIRWDFGDGTTAAGQTPEMSHTYRQQGSYTLTLSVTDNQGATATDFVAISVVDSPLILVAGGQVTLNSSAESKSSKIVSWLESANGVYFYSGETLRAEGYGLVAIPEVSLEAADSSRSNANSDANRVEAIAPSQRNSEQATVSLVEADDSVQYQRIDTLQIQVPQHHDLVSDVLLQTSLMGYDPVRLDIKAHRDRLKTIAGWSELFPAGESTNRPNVIEVGRGQLIIPAGVTLENIAIVVKRGDIAFKGEGHTVSGVTLIAQNGGVDLGNLKATAIKVFASKTIQTTAKSRFQADSILASQQPIVFNGATLEASDCLTIISQQHVRFHASEVTRSQILANADIELGQGTTLQGSIYTQRNVIFNAAATLSAALRTPIVESHKTLTILANDSNASPAINLNIRPPADVEGVQLVIRVVEVPLEVKGILQLADGTRLFPGKQLTSAELTEVSFYPSVEAGETARFVYAIEDSWRTPIKQTVNILFRTLAPATSPVQLTTQPSALWPPARQMVDVKIEGFDKFGPGLAVALDAIACSEPVGAKGAGDSDYDYEIVGDDRVLLRAVQPSNQVNRVYKLLYRVTDTLGNVTYSTLDIPVTLSADIYVIEPDVT